MIMKKLGVLVVFLLVCSSLVLAEDNCDGFNWIKCFLWGDSSQRPVAEWWENE